MTEQESINLQRQGSVARVAGRSRLDNPFFKSEKMPGATGDTVEQWQAKQIAWELGWTCEDMMRP